MTQLFDTPLENFENSLYAVVNRERDDEFDVQ